MASKAVRGGTVREDDLGHSGRPDVAARRHPHGAAEAEPLTGRVVQGVGVLGNVGVGHPERAPDHGGGALEHREAAGHLRGEPDPQQPVLPDRPVHVRAELHPVQAVPQDGLLGDPQVAEGELGHQPGADRAALRGHAGRDAARTGSRSLRAEQPGPFTPAGMCGVLLREDQFVAQTAEQHSARPLVQHAAQPAAPGRVRRYLERVVADHRAQQRGPARGHGARVGPGAGVTRGFSLRCCAHPVAAVAQRGHVRQERDPHAGQAVAGVPPDPLGQERHVGPGLVGQGQPRRARRGELQGAGRQPGPGPRQRVEHDDRAGLRVPAGPGRCVLLLCIHQAGQEARRFFARLLAPLERLPPPAEQVQVHLVGLGAGDRVVVRAEHQLPPRLVQRLGRVSGAGQPGQRGQPLAVGHRHLGGPLGLLGVDVGHVLARVHRVHVPGLRGEPDAALGGLGAHRREELPRQPGHAPRPGVAGGEVPVHLGRPPGRDDVVGADRQQHVPCRRHRGEQGKLRERLPFGFGQVGGLVDHPARAVMVGHVAGQQPPAVGGDPLELAGELHPGVVADRAPRAPLVVRPARPGRSGHPGRRHQPRVTGVVPERVQRPGDRRVRAEHVPLVPEPVDDVADRGLGRGQVGVGLVVRAADEFRPPGRDQLPQFRPVLRVRVEVRLEVVHLGQHELVVGVVAGRVQVQPHQLERRAHVGQPAVLARHRQPRLGEPALGVPPDRVVVEVADHPDGPPRLGGGDLARLLGPGAGALRDHRHAEPAARPVRGGDGHRDLGGPFRARGQLADAGRPRRGHPGALDPDVDRARCARPRRPARHGDPHDLARAAFGADEQGGGLCLHDPHDLIVTRHGQVPAEGAG